MIWVSVCSTSVCSSPCSGVPRPKVNKEIQMRNRISPPTDGWGLFSSPPRSSSHHPHFEGLLTKLLRSIKQPPSAFPGVHGCLLAYNLPLSPPLGGGSRHTRHISVTNVNTAEPVVVACRRQNPRYTQRLNKQNAETAV